MTTPTRDSVLAELRLLESGIQKYPSNGNMTLASVTYTDADLLSRIGACIDAVAAAKLAHGALTEAIANEERVLRDASEFLAGVKKNIQRRFSNASATLIDFGLAPKKQRRAATTEEKLVRDAKVQATRAKRGTKGKRQKAAIKGKVTGVVITPIVGGEGKK